MTNLSLSNFQIIYPEFKISQSDTLNWLIDAHIASERSNPDIESFKQLIKARFNKVACKAEYVEFRNSSTKDYLHTNWDKMIIYTLNENSSGKGLEDRTKVFSFVADDIFKRFYQDCNEAPANIIHATCTGYTSPSALQKLVSYKKWGEKTHVTHAYHMGCYSSIPSIKIAQGFCSLTSKPTDIVHTEICSLHTNPSLHDAPNIVAQSLFADGFVKYTIGKNPGLAILAVHQEIIDGTEKAMLWDVSEYGFKIHLAKEIPVLIARNLESFLLNLLKNTKHDLKSILKEAIFAIHPGGPKIIQNIQKVLKLEDWQINASRQVLKKHGNMSSATLPHIWKSILEDKKVDKNTLVISLAFGPGLSIMGCALRKEL